MGFPIFSRGKILNFGHRGHEKKAPENTIAAFRLAMEEGADGVELDVQVSCDGELVVIHDPKVDRTTNGSGLVRTKTLAQLKELDAGSWFAPEFAGEKIPTLDEVFTALPSDAVVAVELKPLRVTDTVPRKVIETVERHKAENRVLLLSYNPFAINHCKLIRPDLPVMLSHQPDLREYLIQFCRMITQLEPDVRSYEPCTLIAHPELVVRNNKKGIVVLSGTILEEHEMRRVRDLGVVGIMTNDPAALKKVLAEK